MTSREEALRALEKEMQADGGRVEYYTGRLSAILATASEQARYQKARDFDVFRMAGGDTECCPNPTFEEAYRCVCDLRSNYDELLASPAHTSEARDAARYRWMRRGLANTKLLPDGVADLFANALDQNDATKFDAAIDAAMRQEAGSRD